MCDYRWLRWQGDTLPMRGGPPASVMRTARRSAAREAGPTKSKSAGSVAAGRVWHGVGGVGKWFGNGLPVARESSASPFPNPARPEPVEPKATEGQRLHFPFADARKLEAKDSPSTSSG